MGGSYCNQGGSYDRLVIGYSVLFRGLCLFSLFMFVRAVNEDLKEYEYYGFEDDENDG